MSRIITLIIIAISVVTVGAPLLAQTDTTFTYQGELNENGSPANGLFEMDFRLWDAVSAGNQIDSTITFREVSVVEGKFTVQLDFGANAFDNNGRWLEITVNGSTLSPRTPITRAPYSIQTRGIFVNDTGDVGIGTTMPQYPLEVHNSGTTGQILRLESDQTYGYVEFREGSTARALLGFGDPGDLLDNAIPDSFAINGLSSAIHLAVDNDAKKGITIGTNGKLGIGTATPLDQLHALGDAPGLRLEDNGPVSYTALRNSAQTQAQLQKLNLVGNVVFDIDPMPLDGSSDSSLRLFRSTDTTGLKRVLFYRGDNSTTQSAAIGLDGADSYFQLQGGNVGIGTAIPEYPLHVDSFSNHGGSVVGINHAGFGYGIWGIADGDGIAIGVRGEGPGGFPVGGYDFFAAGGGIDYGSSSSRRWKSNIVAIDQPLEKISQLEGVYFDWDKEHGGHHDVGMIAEDVGAVLPEIVRYEENGVDAKGMDYSKLTPLLVEAVNALNDKQNSHFVAQAKRFIQLEHENTALKTQNDALRSRLESLETLVEQLALTQNEKTK